MHSRSHTHLRLPALFPWPELPPESEICCPCNSLYWNSIYPLPVSNSTECLKTSLITKDRKSLFPSESNSVFVGAMLMFVRHTLTHVIFIHALKYPQKLVTLNPSKKTEYLALWWNKLECFFLRNISNYYFECAEKDMPSAIPCPALLNDRHSINTYSLQIPSSFYNANFIFSLAPYN